LLTTKVIFSLQKKNESNILIEKINWNVLYKKTMEGILSKEKKKEAQLVIIT